MHHKIGAIYHPLIESQYGIWAIIPFKGHLVLKDGATWEPGGLARTASTKV